jgi:tetratricopeptide (TPR) repeat protein
MIARSLPLLLLALVPSLRAQSAHTPDPRAIIREAERAVQGRQIAALAGRSHRALELDTANAAALFAQATLERLTYRYDDATRDFDRLRALPASTGARYRAYAALGETEIFYNGAREADAVSASRSALEIARATHDNVAEVLALVTIGALRLRSETPDAARATFDSAARALPAADLDLRARVRCGRASVLARNANATAITEARAGAQLARTSGSNRVLAYCLHVAASGTERTGHIYAADRLLDTAATLARSLGDRHELATILQWRGYAAFEREQLDSAQRLLGEAIAESEASRSVSPLAWSTLNLGQVSVALDDPISAQAHMTRALALMRQLGDKWGTTVALSYVAELALESGDVDHADTLFAELNDRARRVGDGTAIAQTSYSLATIAARRHDWSRASTLLDSAGAAFRRTGLSASTGALAYEHGLIALWKGSPTEAERMFRAALAATDSSEHVSRYLVQSRLASARLALGDTAGAERLLSTATDEVDAWRGGLSDSTLRVLAFQALDRFGGAELGAPSILAAIAASGHVAPAFELAERRRARVLRDGLLRSRLVKSKSDGAHGTFALDASRVTLAAVARALPANAALIEFIAGRGGQPTTAIVITQRSSFAIPIAPVDSLRDDIDRFLAVMQSGRSDTVSATALGHAILGTVVRRLPPGITDLVFVPEDALHRLPFAALIIDGHRVIEHYAVHVVPSAAVALSLWSARPAPGPARMLAFGDARFPLDNARDAPETRAHFAAFAMNGGLTQLTASAIEVREAVRHWPRSVALLGADASEANLKRIRLGQFRLLHFATHAAVDERAPGRSSIALAAGGGEDGFVTAADLSSLRLNADLVMLSGCSTALGLIINGEGILGLTGPLLQAGSHSVAATLWPVPDAESAELVKHFYDFLASGVTASDALRLAQLDAIHRGVPPRDWAAFVLTGDGFVRVGAPATASR